MEVIFCPRNFFGFKKSQAWKRWGNWLVDAINLLKKEGVPIYAVVIENGKYYDTGNKFEYLKTVIEFALQHKE